MGFVAFLIVFVVGATVGGAAVVAAHRLVAAREEMDEEHYAGVRRSDTLIFGTFKSLLRRRVMIACEAYFGHPQLGEDRLERRASLTQADTGTGGRTQHQGNELAAHLNAYRDDDGDSLDYTDYTGPEVNHLFRNTAYFGLIVGAPTADEYEALFALFDAGQDDAEVARKYTTSVEKVSSVF